MNILSFEFLAFVAGVVVVFYLLPQRFRWVVLLAASLGFYLCGGWQGTVYLVAVAGFTWMAGKRIGRLRARMEAAEQDGSPELARVLKQRVRVWLTHCLILVLGALVCVKYAEPGREMLNHLLKALRVRAQLNPFTVLVPLGLSYFTFQSAGYLIDVYWGKVQAQPNFFRHLLFVSFFPQIVQGPISTYGQLGPQLMHPQPFHPWRFTMGFQRMVWGYFKKLVLADRLAGVTMAVAAGENQPGWLILLGISLYAVRLYGDFSGGMDVVRGVVQMLGVDLTENFRRPFFSRSVAEYWRRWHISLGAWFRSYVLYPFSTSRFGVFLGRLGKRMLGNKTGRMLPGAVATFLIFLLIGLWHGANWNAAIYGAYFGILCGGAALLEPLFKKMRKAMGISGKTWWWNLLCWARTMLLVLLAQYFACTAGPAQGFALLRGTFSQWNFDGFAEIMTGLLPWLEWGIAGAALLVVLLVDLLCERGVDVNGGLARGRIFLRWPVLLVLILAIAIFGHYGEGFDAAAFLYTNF